ncbi:MAG: DUF1002 domain-containing protein [Clostridiales bacterium]|nr:DUF1002 domain-containing protein [Clostridiales bacterium]
MNKRKKLVLLCLVCGVCMWSMTASASSEKGVESVVGWILDRIAEGETGISDESSIREAIEEGKQELSVTLSREEEDRIVSFVESLDTLETEAGDFAEQAKELYQKYSVELVEEADDAIGEAVSQAVEGAVAGFFQSLKQTISDFFKNLFSA